jgi:hypothetical protein
LDTVVVVREDGGDRNQGKRIGRAVAHFAIDLPARGRRRQHHRSDQLARREHRFDIRRFAGRAIERVDREGAGRAVGRDSLDSRIVRGHGDGHVGRVRGDAIVAHAEHGVHAVEAAERGAAGARHALVAGLAGIIEVRAARALQQVAAGGRLVAKLPGRTGQDRLRQQRILAPHAHVGGERAVRHQRADAQAVLRRFFDAAERQRVDVDEMRRRLDFELHEIDEVGAAGDELRGRFGRRCTGRCDAVGSFIAKRFHERPPSATSRIAATMLG